MIRKWIGLILKWAVAAALAPWVWTMTRSFAGSLTSADVTISQRLVAFIEGVGLYLVLHIAFWKPKPIYLLGHRLLQKLFQVLLGGQVQTIPQGPMGQGSEVAAKPKAAAGSKEQTLAAVSPALIPVYTILLAVVLGLLRSTAQLMLSDETMCRLVGISVALHLLMAIDTIQETRAQQTFVGYLLTLEFIALATLVVTTLCLAFLLPDLSVGGFFQQAFQETLAIYTAGLNELLY